MKLEKMGIVVLNYNNYQVTIDCVEYILKQTIEVPIVVVDNGSKNDSLEILTKRFSNKKQVFVCSSEENIGFSRGNNIGIKFLRDLKCENILLINSDVFLKDKEFISSLEKIQIPDNVGVVGTAIFNQMGTNQNPASGKNGYINLYILLLNLLRLKMGISSHGIFSSVRKKIVVKTSVASTDIEKKKISNQILDSQHYLHGSAFILTSKFFENFDGLYNRTFLYFEEPILSVAVRKAGLQIFYIDELSVSHLEDQSSNAIGKSNSKAWVNYSIHGIREFIRVKRMPLNVLKSYMKV